MPIYELRTYDITVGKMAEVVQLYKTLGYPALEKGGYADNLVAYFTGDVGALNQLVHLWKFEDANDRQDFWDRLFSDEDFMAFAGQLRPLVRQQENKLLKGAPWGNQL